MRSALFPGVFKIGYFVVRSQNHHLSAFFLKLPNITVTEFGTPLEP